MTKMAEQFCLRWNNHQSTLVSVFENLLESETLTDCTLAAEGRYLKAHKVVLSACSPYFESILCQHYDKHPIVVLKDVKFYEMRAILDYMYRGEVNISQDQLDAFIKTAESLQIKGLTDQGGGDGDSDDRDVGSTNKRRGSSLKSSAPEMASESPLVGNTPLREGSTSPSSLKRRRRQRHSSQGNGETLDSHVDTSNSCDIPQQILAVAASVPNAQTAPASGTPSHPQQTASEPIRPVIKKTEPPDVIQPKIEMDEHSDDVEDLTLDDDEDYGGSDISKPGTSYSGPASQDYSPWQMTGERTTDEVFMAAQEAINNQSNSQGFGFSSLKNHICFSCGKAYKYRDNLKRHQHYECGKEPEFQCTQCPYKSFQKCNLVRHVDYIHNKSPKTFHCPLCSYECRQKSDLTRHMYTKHECVK